MHSSSVWISDNYQLHTIDDFDGPYYTLYGATNRKLLYTYDCNKIYKGKKHIASIIDYDNIARVLVDLWENITK